MPPLVRLEIDRPVARPQRGLGDIRPRRAQAPLRIEPALEIAAATGRATRARLRAEPVMAAAVGRGSAIQAPTVAEVELVAAAHRRTATAAALRAEPALACAGHRRTRTAAALGIRPAITCSASNGLTFYRDFIDVPELNPVGAIGGPITFTRASAATRINEAGLIESVAAGVLRFDCDPVTLARRGPLTESVRSNLLLRSNDFAHAAWTKVATSVATGSAVGPDGTMSGSLVEETSGSAIMAQAISGTFPAGSAVVGSAFLRRGNHDWVRLRLTNGSNGINAWFRLSDRTVGTIAAIGTATGAIGYVEPMRDGWVRCCFGCMIPGVTSATMDLLSADADGSTARAGAGATRYQFGAQVEAGGFATSYISTTTTTVTRAEDVLRVALPNAAINLAQGTLLIDAIRSNISPATAFALGGFDSGSVSDRLHLLYHNAVDTPLAFLTRPGVDTNTSGPSGSVTGRCRMAVAYRAGAPALAMSYNGRSTTQNGAAPSGPLTSTNLWIGRRFDSLNINGHIATLAYWPIPLSNAQLQALSAL